MTFIKINLDFVSIQDHCKYQYFCFNINSLPSPTLEYISDIYYGEISGGININVNKIFKEKKDIIIKEINDAISSSESKLNELLDDKYYKNIAICKEFLRIILCINDKAFSIDFIQSLSSHNSFSYSNI